VISGCTTATTRELSAAAGKNHDLWGDLVSAPRIVLKVELRGRLGLPSAHVVQVADMIVSGQLAEARHSTFAPSHLGTQ
jgi:hypothetical protein